MTAAHGASHMILTAFAVNRYSGLGDSGGFGVAQCSLTYRSDAHDPVKKDARAHGRPPGKEFMKEPWHGFCCANVGAHIRGFDRRTQPASRPSGICLARARRTRDRHSDLQRHRQTRVRPAAIAQHDERAMNRSRTLCLAHAAISQHRVRRSRDLRTIVSMTAVFLLLSCNWAVSCRYTDLGGHHEHLCLP